jgi:hypothetical protein
VAPAGLAATCGDGVLFPAIALNGPGKAESDPDSAAAALRAFLAEPQTGEVKFPATGWHRVHETLVRVHFVARLEQGDPWAQVAFSRNGGAWTLDVSGACAAQVALGGGLRLAEWYLDPALPRPGPGDLAFTALVTERLCAGGKPPDGRIAPPLVSYRTEAVTVIFGVRPLPGGQDCPANPPGRYKVTLDQPFGDRLLLDGGSIPPRDATNAP